MIIILHGDDEVKIHKELSVHLLDLHAKNIQVTRLDAKGLSLPDLESQLGTQELFAVEKAIVIDRLHGLLKSKAKDELIEHVSNHTDEAVSIILVENKILTATQLKKFPRAQIHVFKLPMVLFSFVDSLGMSTPAKLITTFHQILETQDAEFVFAMIMRQIRMLIAYVNDGTYSGSPFGKTKIINQSRKFDIQKLLFLHGELLRIDIGQKTSRSAFTLTQEIDLLLSQI